MPQANFPDLALANIPGTGKLYARFHTSMGNIVVELEEERAPNTVKNFVGLATGTQEWTDPKTGETKKGVPLYDGTIFHRVIEDFMIQGGCPLGAGRGNPGYRFADEIHPALKHTGPGILSMANSGPNTNGCQFFITEKATPWLDGKHAVFGRTVAGLENVPKITRVPQGPGNKPLTDVKLVRLEIFRSPTVPAA